MNLTINSKNLLTALNIVGKAISQTGILPVTKCFRIQNNSGGVQITACNMYVEISTACLAETADVFDFLIPADKLYELNTIENQDLVFNLETFIKVSTKYYRIQIISKSGKYEITGWDGEDFPRIQTEYLGSFDIDYADFGEVFYRTEYTILNDTSGNKLGALNAEFSEDEAVFVSCDGMRMSVFYLQGKFADAKLLIPVNVVSILKNIPISGECTVNYSQKSISLLFGDTTIKAILMDEVYPDWRPMVVDNKNYITVNREELAASMKRVLGFTSKVSQKITLKIGSKLTVYGEDLDFEHKAYELLESNYTGEELTIAVTGNPAIQVINNMTTETVVLTFSAHNKPLIVKEKLEDKSFVAILPLVATI